MAYFCGTHGKEKRLKELGLFTTFAETDLYLYFYACHHKRNIFEEQNNDEILKWVISYLSDAVTGAKAEEEWRCGTGRFSIFSEDVKRESAYHNIRDALNYRAKKKLSADLIIEECNNCKEVLEVALRQEDIEMERYNHCSDFLCSVLSYYEIKRSYERSGFWI